MPGGDGTGPSGTRPGGIRRGKMGLRQGPGGNCICPKCKTRVPHQRGTPCYSITCPNCGTSMIRE